jgi:hypothetical protein
MTSRTYTYENVCDHYNHKMQRNIISRTRFWIRGDVLCINRVNGLKAHIQDFIWYQVWDIFLYNINEDDNTYECEIWVKDRDVCKVLTFLNSEGFKIA